MRRKFGVFLAIEGALLCVWGGAALLEACATGSIAGADASTGADSSSSGDGGGGCGANQTSCNGTCVNLQSDPSNCGQCGVGCSQGNVCSQGNCQANCGGGTTKCGNACVDTKTDNANCGQCSHACTNATCDGGVCIPNCTAQQKLCDGDGGLFCANVQTDDANCGDCNVVCQQGLTCQTGKCLPTCLQNETLCDIDGSADGGPPFCTDTKTDNANCGACDQPCTNGKSCDGGTCVSPPPTCANANGLLWCYNGGACGEACTAVCAHFGKTPVSNATTWLNAQNTTNLCQNIATAFGVATVGVSGYTYACAEDSWGQHGFDGGLIGPLLCSTTTNCPVDHLGTMDQGGINCDASTQTRRSICACQ